MLGHLTIIFRELIASFLTRATHRFIGGRRATLLGGSGALRTRVPTAIRDNSACLRRPATFPLGTVTTLLLRLFVVVVESLLD